MAPSVVHRGRQRLVEGQTTTKQFFHRPVLYFEQMPNREPRREVAPGRLIPRGETEQSRLADLARNGGSARDKVAVSLGDPGREKLGTERPEPVPEEAVRTFVRNHFRQRASGVLGAVVHDDIASRLCPVEYDQTACSQGGAKGAARQRAQEAAAPGGVGEREFKACSGSVERRLLDPQPCRLQPDSQFGGRRLLRIDLEGTDAPSVGEERAWLVKQSEVESHRRENRAVEPSAPVFSCGGSGVGGWNGLRRLRHGEFG